MKTRVLSKLNSGLLLLVAIVLSWSVYWGMKQLRVQLDKRHVLNKYRSYVNDEVAASINAYLRSENAADLADAEKAMQQLDLMMRN
ncbi:hypothetical protein [Hahella ganghwensis]|uniref:hypothetical protein n=1 Tax=Hahella ganghwensis TaxID=286420 RepID=UPI000361BD91|nr:hypothetical protein [Hahella ganghwensis]